MELGLELLPGILATDQLTVGTLVAVTCLDLTVNPSWLLSAPSWLRRAPIELLLHRGHQSIRVSQRDLPAVPAESNRHHERWRRSSAVEARPGGRAAKATEARPGGPSQALDVVPFRQLLLPHVERQCYPHMSSAKYARFSCQRTSDTSSSPSSERSNVRMRIADG